MLFYQLPSARPRAGRKRANFKQTNLSCFDVARRIGSGPPRIPSKLGTGAFDGRSRPSIAQSCLAELMSAGLNAGHRRSSRATLRTDMLRASSRLARMSNISCTIFLWLAAPPLDTGQHILGGACFRWGESRSLLLQLSSFGSLAARDFACVAVLAEECHGSAFTCVVSRSLRNHRLKSQTSTVCCHQERSPWLHAAGGSTIVLACLFARHQNAWGAQ